MKLDTKPVWEVMLVSVITNEIVMKEAHCDEALHMNSILSPLPDIPVFQNVWGRHAVSQRSMCGFIRIANDRLQSGIKASNNTGLQRGGVSV